MFASKPTGGGLTFVAASIGRRVRLVEGGVGIDLDECVAAWQVEADHTVREPS
jgi:hypothetical protein